MKDNHDNEQYFFDSGTLLWLADLVERFEPAVAGWMGHAAPFSFEAAFRPATGIERVLVGTPSVIGMASLDAALEVWDEVDMGDVRERSIEYAELAGPTEQGSFRFGVPHHDGRIRAIVVAEQLQHLLGPGSLRRLQPKQCLA